MRTAKTSIGEKFGRLTVLSISHVDNHRVSHVLCKCDCGTEKIVRFSSLSSGGLRSCGCLHREAAKATAVKHCTTHGMSRSPTYRSWLAMVARCTNPKHNRSHIYSGAGVSVCERWRKFENFLADMGERPEGMSLDRFPDGAGDYGPGNCRWATSRQQALNRRTTRWLNWEGRTESLKDLAGRAGIKRLTLTMRLKRGWSLDKALTTPVRASRGGSDRE